MGAMHTPLEYALIYGCSTLDRTFTLTKFMLEKGAILTEAAKKTILQKCDDFSFRKDSYEGDYLKENQEAYNQLFTIMNLEIPKEIIKHDGKADIELIGDNQKDIYNNLWDYLVPGNGRAKSGQGECIRLIGRLSYEILDNGCINWCSDFKLMAKTISEYFKLGQTLDDEIITNIDNICNKISKNTSESDIHLLMNYVVTWIGLNPKVLPLIEANYKR